MSLSKNEKSTTLLIFPSILARAFFKSCAVLETSSKLNSTLSKSIPFNAAFAVAVAKPSPILVLITPGLPSTFLTATAFWKISCVVLTLSSFLSAFPPTEELSIKVTAGFPAEYAEK